MTHIATHPPDGDTGATASSPAFRMFGYLTLAKPEAPFEKVNEAESFKILFFNNTGLAFEPDDTIGCHIAFFEVGEGSPLHDKKAKKYCALAYDLVKYQTHKEAEREVLGDVRAEDLTADELDKKVKNHKFGDGKKKEVMEQAVRYRRTSSFEVITGLYAQPTLPAAVEWMKANVVNYDHTKRYVYGCGRPDGNREIPDFDKVIHDRLAKMPGSPFSNTSVVATTSTAPVASDGGVFTFVSRIFSGIGRLFSTT